MEHSLPGHMWKTILTMGTDPSLTEAVEERTTVLLEKQSIDYMELEPLWWLKGTTLNGFSILLQHSLIFDT